MSDTGSRRQAHFHIVSLPTRIAHHGGQRIKPATSVSNTGAPSTRGYRARLIMEARRYQRRRSIQEATHGTSQ